eukprot:scpid86363/ scgid18971/ 
MTTDRNSSGKAGSTAHTRRSASELSDGNLTANTRRTDRGAVLVKQHREDARRTRSRTRGGMCYALARVPRSQSNPAGVGPKPAELFSSQRTAQRPYFNLGVRCKV